MGKTAKELVDDFHTAMDDYLTLCEDEGVKSEAAYKGSFHIRISTDRTEQKTTLLGQKSGFASFLYDFRKDGVLVMYDKRTIQEEICDLR